MTGGFIIAGLAAIGIGLTRDPWVAGGLLTLFGLDVVTFNVIMGSLRQQLIPDRLLGRVISAFRLFSYGSVPLGALSEAWLLGGSAVGAFLWVVWRIRSWRARPAVRQPSHRRTRPSGREQEGALDQRRTVLSRQLLPIAGGGAMPLEEAEWRRSR